MIGHNGNIKTLIICALTLSIFSACAEPFSLLTDEILVPLQVNLTYDSSNVSQLDEGEIRCVVKAYPAVQEGKEETFSEEFTFTGDLLDDFDNQLVVGVPEGDYNIMVWADLIEDGAGAPFYDVADFGEIRLVGEHRGSTDYRDALCGSAFVSVSADTTSSAIPVLDIDLQRPLARYELIAEDFTDFINANPSADIDDYTAVIQYVGFMPNAFSMYTDRPVDSATGVSFRSDIAVVSDTEARIGFDYVFVNNKESAVTIRVGILDPEGELISMTAPVKVPLNRGDNTVLRGRYMTKKPSGGIGVDPDYEGDHNLNL